jgi:hypothetical protein
MRRSKTLRANKREVGEIVQNWENNKSFSQKLPRFQTSIDSTSLGAFKQCARYYYYSIICGYTKIGVQIHLDFGSAAHHVSENYQRARSQGIEHEAALEATIVKALSGTWDYKANAPAFDDPQKNRLSLIRFAVEYLDHYEKQGSPLKTLQLENGKPAVELTFLFDAGFRSMTNEIISLCGHIDRLVAFNDDIFIADLKTTMEAISSKYAERFTPDNQFTLYTIAGRVALGVPARGILLDAAQIGVNFVRFQRFPVYRPQPVLDEWLQALPYWVSLMESCAVVAEPMPNPEAAYPQNDKACGLYGGCQFREICGRSPLARKPIMDATFQIRRWDPAGEPR